MFNLKKVLRHTIVLGVAASYLAGPGIAFAKADANQCRALFAQGRPGKDWYWSRATLALIPDPFSRDAVDMVVATMFRLRQMDEMTKDEVDHFRTTIAKLAQIYTRDERYADFLITEPYIEIMNFHADLTLSSSSNLERDMAFLRTTGFDKFLAKVPFGQKLRSLSWWMEKESLPSLPVGQGSGKTAQELELRYIKHGTKTDVAKTIAPSGKPGALNLLSSRPGKADESADFGAGHYCVREGNAIPIPHSAVIHYELLPNARVDHDFKTVFDFDTMQSYVIVLNKAAIRLVRLESHGDLK